MGLNFDPSLLALAVVNSQTVGYEVALTDATLAPDVDVPNAHRRAPTKEEADLFPQVTVVWHLWAQYLGTITPKIKDVIVDKGTGERWQIEKVFAHGWGHRYRCLTFKENW